MPSLTQIRKDISCLPTSFPLVIAIFGGTTGIGSYVARSFARLFSQHGANLRVYLVGRNASRAEEILAYAKKTAPESDWTFVEVGNAALMSECERVAGVIKEREERQPFEDGTGGKRARLDAIYLSWALSPVVNSPCTSLSPFILSQLSCQHIVNLGLNTQYVEKRDDHTRRLSLTNSPQ